MQALPDERSPRETEPKLSMQNSKIPQEKQELLVTILYLIQDLFRLRNSGLAKAPTLETTIDEISFAIQSTLEIREVSMQHESQLPMFSAPDYNIFPTILQDHPGCHLDHEPTALEIPF